MIQYGIIQCELNERSFGSKKSRNSTKELNKAVLIHCCCIKTVEINVSKRVSHSLNHLETWSYIIRTGITNNMLKNPLLYAGLILQVYGGLEVP